MIVGLLLPILLQSSSSDVAITPNALSLLNACLSSGGQPHIINGNGNSRFSRTTENAFFTVTLFSPSNQGNASVVYKIKGNEIPQQATFKFGTSLSLFGNEATINTFSATGPLYACSRVER